MKQTVLIITIFVFLTIQGRATEIMSPLDSSKCQSKYDSVFKRGIYVFADSTAKFPGGMKSMFRFISDNVDYPLRLCQPVGNVYVEFIVEINGALTNKKIVKGLNDPTDAATLKVIDQMPNRVPGFCNGTSVRSRVIIPVKFRIR